MKVPDLIEALGGPAGVGKALGVPANTVATWKRRDRIPAAWWVEVAEMARGRGVKGVTTQTLKAQRHAAPAEAAA